MDNTNEKLSTIITKMRGENFKPPVYQKRVNDYADRIKAAAKRERESAEADALYAGAFIEATRHGNAAAMRKALEKVEKLNHYDLGCIRSIKRRDEIDAKILEIEKTVRAALAAPSRNCDRFQNFDEAIKTYAKENNVTVPWDMETYARMAIWLFAPVEQKRRC